MVLFWRTASRLCSGDERNAHADVDPLDALAACIHADAYPALIAYSYAARDQYFGADLRRADAATHTARYTQLLRNACRQPVVSGLAAQHTDCANRSGDHHGVFGAG